MGRQHRNQPDNRQKNAIRFIGASVLAVAAAIANATTYDEFINVAGSARVKVRTKLTTTGTLDLTFGYFDNDGNFTAYTTGNPAQVALAANVESAIASDTYGENWARVRVTGGGVGAVTYVDVSQV